MNTKKNNRKEKRGNHNVLNISSSTTTFPKYPSKDPTEPTSLQSSSLYKIQKLSKLRCPSSLLEQKKKKRKENSEGKKEIAQETSGKDNKRSGIYRDIGSDWVARTFYLRRDWTVANQSIDFTCFLRGRDESRVGWSISSGYHDDIETIVSSCGNLHRGGGKKVRERLPGEELRSTGGYWICVRSRWRQFHPFEDRCFL